MNTELLTQLGLSESEILLYSAVVRGGQLSPADLAKAIGIKRTTAYSMGRSLVEKGLLIEDATRRPRVFVPAGPEHMQDAIEKEKKRSAERQDMLLRLSEQVSQRQSEQTYPVPRITFIEDTKIRSFLSKRGKEWNESMLSTNEKTFWGFQDPTLLEHYDDWITEYWRKAPEELEVKLLTNLSPTERVVAKKYPRRETKYWGEAANFLSTTWVIGDYVVILNTRNKPFYLIEIHDKLMAHDQREIFKNLWNLV